MTIKTVLSSDLMPISKKNPLEQALEDHKNKNKAIGSHEKESIQDQQDRSKKRKEGSKESKEEQEEAEGSLKESSQELEDAIEEGERENEKDDDKDKKRSSDDLGDSDKGEGGGSGEGQGAGKGGQTKQGFSLTGQSKIAQLQILLDDWIKKLLGVPLTKHLYDPTERSRRVPGLWGREIEETIPKKGEKVLIIVLDLSGSIMSYANLIKKVLFTISERLVKGKAVTKIYFKDFDGGGPAKFLSMPEFKEVLRKEISSGKGTGSYPHEAWTKMREELKILNRHIETISGLVIITDFQFFEDSLDYPIPREVGKIPILGLAIGDPHDYDIAKFFNYNKGKQVRVLKVTPDNKVSRVVHKED